MTKLQSINPADFSVVGEVEVSTLADIKSKVDSARKAFDSWRKTPLLKRLEYIALIRNEVAQNQERIAELTTLEMGKPIKESGPSVESNLKSIDWWLEHSEDILKPATTIDNSTEIHQIVYEPLGVTAVIAPWNYPPGNLLGPVITNLIVGNTVVFKHSELCPLSGEYLAKILNNILPPGVFNLVTGNGIVGEHLVNQDINLIYFTGSCPVGQKLYEIAANKFIRVFLELGGSAPGVIFASTDLDKMTGSIFGQKFHNNGQVCVALKRLIVEESIVDDLIKQLSRLLGIKNIGDPTDPNTDFGPLASAKQLEHAQKQLDDAIRQGAKIVAKLDVPKTFKGAYLSPIILTNIKKSMKIWREEVFAPILPVATFKNEKEAIEIANDTKYGLGGYVYSSDIEQAKRVAAEIITGNVSINGPEYYRYENPFGGAKFSGIGRQKGTHGLQDLCNIKVIALKK